MIELKKVNKYFYHHKKNEVHVINNTTLTLPDTGLVAILGESGSGKTTLLNAIGGLDGYNSGSIYINGKKLKKHNADKVRNLNIGYVFQDYKLVDNLSVYDNIALSLKLCGFKDKKEIEKKVDYVTNILGLYRYRKREVTMLSGGERQRVGIARAIVKNPNIVICDEPTGNLDSKNSIEIMNIIKCISKERLVLLVTHETELADFYADRIISIVDGKVVSDVENKNAKELNYEVDNKIYLKDIENYKSIDIDGTKINYYFDKESKNKIDIVFKNGNLLINTNIKHTEVINDSTALEFVDDHQKKIDKSVYEKYEFKMEDFKKKNVSLYNIFNMLLVGIKNISKFSFIKKLLLAVYIIAAGVVMFAVSTGLAVLQVEKKDYTTDSDTYLSVVTKKDPSIYFDILNNYDVNYIIPGNQNLTFRIPIDYYTQTKDLSVDYAPSIADVSLISEDDLIFGNMPTSNNEIVIDELVYDYIKGFNDKEDNYTPDNTLLIGITELSDMLNLKVTFNGIEYYIVGIVSKETPCAYMNIGDYNTIVRNGKDSYYYYEPEYTYYDYNNYTNEIKLVNANNYPKNDYEIIVNYDLREEYPINTKLKTNKINGNKVKVVGYYKSTTVDKMLTTSNTVLLESLSKSNNIIVSTNNKDEVISELKEAGYAVTDLNVKAYDKYQSSNKNTVNTALRLSGIVLVVVFIEIFFMVRSSFMSRVKEVGILRAIGVKKSDIYKMFIGETVVSTTVGCVVGSIFSYGLIDAFKQITMLSSKFYLSPMIILYTFVIMYVFTILVAMIPIHNVIRKYPAVILTRKDI